MSDREPRIFLSYAAIDRTFAQGVSRELERHGFSATLNDELFAPGERSDRTFERALRDADFFLVVLSDKSLDSPALNFELGAAVAQKKAVIPLFRSRRARNKAKWLPITTRKGVTAEGLRGSTAARKLLSLLDPGLRSAAAM